MPSGQSTWNYYFVFHLYLPYSFLHIPGSRKHPIRSSTWNYYFVFHLYLSYYYFYIFCFWKLNGGFMITVYLWGSACNYQSSKAPMCFMCWKCTLVSRMCFDPPNSPLPIRDDNFTSFSSHPLRLTPIRTTMGA